MVSRIQKLPIQSECPVYNTANLLSFIMQIKKCNGLTGCQGSWEDKDMMHTGYVVDLRKFQDGRAPDPCCKVPARVLTDDGCNREHTAATLTH